MVLQLWFAGLFLYLSKWDYNLKGEGGKMLSLWQRKTARGLECHDKRYRLTEVKMFLLIEAAIKNQYDPKVSQSRRSLKTRQLDRSWRCWRFSDPAVGGPGTFFLLFLPLNEIGIEKRPTMSPAKHVMPPPSSHTARSLKERKEMVEPIQMRWKWSQRYIYVTRTNCHLQEERRYQEVAETWLGYLMSFCVLKIIMK